MIAKARATAAAEPVAEMASRSGATPAKSQKRIPERRLGSQDLRRRRAEPAAELATLEEMTKKR